MTEPSILREDKGNVSTLWINRPQRLNALDYDTIDRLLDAFDDLAVRPTCRVVILTATGERAFSAGADLYGLAHSLATDPGSAVYVFAERGQRLTARIEAFPKPVIVAVNGLAYGAGCEITEAAPLAIAAASASFAKPEARLGFPPPFGGTQRLPRLIGRKRAIEMILTGEPISAHQAEDLGLINRVVPTGDLLNEANALARRLLELDADAVTASLAAVTRGLNVSISEGLAIEAMQFRNVVGSAGVKEGLQRFLARSKANADELHPTE